MATIKIDGLEGYEKKLEQLNVNVTGILKRGVYEGADVVADAVRASISSLPTVSNKAKMAAYGAKEATNLSEEQKRGLLNGLDLSQMRNNDGVVSTKLGFGGYNTVKTKKYPKGQPNRMIAAAVESGTSASRKQPFFRPAVNKTKSQATAAMSARVTEDINNLMEGN